MGSGKRPRLRRALSAVGLAIGIGIVFLYFFGFLIGIAAVVVVGLVFSVSSIRPGSTAAKVFIAIGLVLALLALTYVFGMYGGIAYVVIMLALYYVRRKKRRPKHSGVPFP